MNATIFFSFPELSNKEQSTVKTNGIDAREEVKLLELNGAIVRVVWNC